jgi:hypothetical protein
MQMKNKIGAIALISGLTLATSASAYLASAPTAPTSLQECEDWRQSALQEVYAIDRQTNQCMHENDYIHQNTICSKYLQESSRLNDQIVAESQQCTQNAIAYRDQQERERQALAIQQQQQQQREQQARQRAEEIQQTLDNARRYETSNAAKASKAALDYNDAANAARAQQSAAAKGLAAAHSYVNNKAQDLVANYIATAVLGTSQRSGDPRFDMLDAQARSATSLNPFQSPAANALAQTSTAATMQVASGAMGKFEGATAEFTAANQPSGYLAPMTPAAVPFAPVALPAENPFQQSGASLNSPDSADNSIQSTPPAAVSGDGASNSQIATNDVAPVSGSASPPASSDPSLSANPFDTAPANAQTCAAQRGHKRAKRCPLN